MTKSSRTKKERNRKAATRYRNKKAKKLELLESNVACWKGKCKKCISERQFQTFEKELKQMKLEWKAGASQEQTSSNETSEAIVVKSGSKYRNRYKPKEKMTEEKEAEWLVEDRKRRNRESAKRSSIKKQKRPRELQEELEFWEGKYNDLTSKTTNNTITTSILTGGRLFSSDSINWPFLDGLCGSQRQLSSMSSSLLFDNEQERDRVGVNVKIGHTIQYEIQISLDERSDDKCDEDFYKRYAEVRKECILSFTHQSSFHISVQRKA